MTLRLSRPLLGAAAQASVESAPMMSAREMAACILPRTWGSVSSRPPRHGAAPDTHGGNIRVLRVREQCDTCAGARRYHGGRRHMTADDLRFWSQTVFLRVDAASGAECRHERGHDEERKSH